MEEPDANMHRDESAQPQDQSVTFELPFCIWCGKEGRNTKAHLIPQFIGGRFAPRTTCQRCNSFIGEKWESTAKKNVFVAAALEGLKMADPQEAYRMGKKVHEETESEMWLRPGRSGVLVPNVLSPTTFLGGMKDAKKHWVAKFNKERPRWPAEPLSDFFEDDTRTTFEYAGMKYSKIENRTVDADVRVDGLQQDIDFRLVFKIAFEFCFYNNLLVHTGIREVFERNYSIDTSGRADRLTLNSEVARRVFANTFVLGNGERYLANLPFARWHYMMLRLSENGLLYFEVGLFKIIRTHFIIGWMKSVNDQIIPCLDRVIILHCDHPDPGFDNYPNLQVGHLARWSSVASEFRAKQCGIVNEI